MAWIDLDEPAGEWVDLDTYVSPPKTEPEKRGVIGFAKDTAIDLAKGVVGFGESVAGIGSLVSFGAIGKGLEAIGYDPKQTSDFLSGFQSDARQQSEKAVAQETGFFGQLKALGTHPDVLIGKIVEALPGTIGAGAVAGTLVKSLAAKAAAEATATGLTGTAATDFIAGRVKDAAFKIAAVASGAEGAQTAGSIAEAGRQAGREWSDYVAPAIAAGLGTAAIGMVSGKIGQKLGIGDLETDVAVRAAGVKGAGAGTGGFLSRIGKEFIKEGALEEMTQSAQEQAFQNIATGKPVSEGVEQAAASGLIVGGAMGGGHAAIAGGSTPAAKPAAPDRTADILNAQDVDTAIAASQKALDEVAAPVEQTVDPLIGSQPEPVNDEQDFNDLLTSETRNLQVMDAQLAQDRQKQSELDAIPAIAADQNIVQSALQRAATLEAPTALEMAFQRARQEPAPAPQEPALPAAPAETAPVQPREVDRSFIEAFNAEAKQKGERQILPMSLAKAEQVAAKSPDAEVVRFPNIVRETGLPNGKFSYTVITKASDGTAGNVRPVDSGAIGGGGNQPVPSVATGMGDSGPAKPAVDAGIAGALSAGGAVSPVPAGDSGGVLGAVGATIRQRIEDAEPMSQAHSDAIDAYQTHLAQGAAQSIDSGEMPVFQSGTVTVTIGPSAQSPGMYQATRYNSTGAIGDSQYRSIDDAVSGEGLINSERLPAPAAAKRMADIVEAEAAYQAKKVASVTAQPAPASVQASDSVPAHFKSLLSSKSTKVILDDGKGRVLYDVKVTPEFRNKNFVNGRLPSVKGLELVRKEDVTKNPSDNGWVLIDNRAQIASREPASAPAPAPQLPAAAKQSPKPKDAGHIGANNIPIAEGGKPFKTKKGADLARKMNPMLRAKQVQGGYVLAPKTEKQLAAEAIRVKRLSQPRTSPPGEPIPAHAFIASEGGLSKKHQNDLGVDGNQKIGNRWLFSALGRGLSIEQATEKLIQEQYLPEGASHTDAYNLIRKSLTQPQYNADGIERIAEAEQAARFDDYLTAQMEDAPADPFGDLDDLDITVEDATVSGYDELSDPIKIEVNALLAQADALGIDTDTIKEKAYEATRNGSEQDYFEAQRSQLQATIDQGNGSRSNQADPRSDSEQGRETAVGQGGADRGADAGQQGGTAEPILTSPTQADIEAQQDRAEQAAKQSAAQRLAAEKQAAQDEDRKRIAKASEAAASTFTLGGDAMDNLTGQGSIFDAPAEAPPASQEPRVIDGFKAGDVVDVDGRTISGWTVKEMFMAPSPLGGDLPWVGMATVASPAGKTLDVLSADLRKPSKPAAEMSASELLRAAADKMDAEKAGPVAKPVDSIGSQTFDQWIVQNYENNEYKDAYLRKAKGNEKIAMLSAATGFTDNERPAEVLKEAKRVYHGKILDLPRESSISLEVFDSFPPNMQIEAQRHFYDLDSRITRRTQDATVERVRIENAKKKPYEDALAEASAEIARLDKISGPETQKQKDLSGRRARLEEAIWLIGQGKEPDGRLIKKAASEVAQPALSDAKPANQGAGKDAEKAGPAQARRTNPTQTIEFKNPIVGPSGEKLVSYTWQWKPFEYVDKTGEERTGKLSDWDKSAGNVDTGREVVHQFTVENKDGETRIVSAESAIAALGYADKASDGSVKSAISAAKTLARNKMQLAELESALSAFMADQTDVNRLALPEVTRGDGGWWSMGDSKVRQTSQLFPNSKPDELLPERMKVLEDGWRSNRLAERGWNLATENTLKEGIYDTKAQIKRAQAKLDAMTPDAAKPENQGAGKDAADPSKTKQEAEQALWERINAGTVTPDEFKAGFENWLKNKDAILSEMLAMKKDELLAKISPYMRARYKSETKPEIAEALWRDGLGSYGLQASITYSLGKDSYANAVRRLVEATDADRLTQYAAEVQIERDQMAQRIADRVKAIADPQTLADYEALIRSQAKEAGVTTLREARMLLTPEQRAKYDELAADKARSDRNYSKEVQQAVKVAGQMVDAAIIETKHTQKGHDLFVVRLAERVERGDYDTLNASAKKMGGYYSSFRGRGAVPGFQFTERATAEAFVKLANGDSTDAQAAADSRRDAFADDRSQSAAERLTEMADRLDANADESLNADRKANTARRAAFASAAEAAARSGKAMAKTMRNIAQALTSGTAKYLDRIRTKTQIDALQGYVNTAHYEQLMAKYPTYAEQEKRKGQPPDSETADFAEFPQFTAYRSDLASLARQMIAADGTKLMGQHLMKVADDVSDAFTKFAKENTGKLMRFRTTDGGLAAFPSQASTQAAIDRSGYRGKAIPFMVKRGEWTIITSPSEAIAQGLWTGDGDKRITLTADFGSELVEKIGKANRRGAKVSVPWQFESAHDKRKMLARMGIETPAELRAALREFIGLREQAAEADRVKVLERAMVGRKNDGLDFFPTPESVADEMIAAADIQPDMAVLEPSAGMGHIADRIRAAGAEPDVIEMANDRTELLEAKGFTVVGSDFMEIGNTSSEQKELDELLSKREAIRTKQMNRLHDGGATRARTTTSNADADKVNERIVWLREQIKNATPKQYDRIVMNPPFSDGRDMAHVQHAYTLLKPGGRLVALMGESAFTNQNKRATEFRAWLEQVGGTDEKLAEGTFLDPSLPVNTGANARMVVVEKPAGDQVMQSVAANAPAPNTPISTIRESLTKAYGKLSSRLESKGLLSIHQTQDEAMQAAAQARADARGTDVETELAGLQDGGTNQSMTNSNVVGNQGGRSADDMRKGALTPDTSLKQGRPGSGMQERPTVRAVTGSLGEPAQSGGGVWSGVNRSTIAKAKQDAIKAANAELVKVEQQAIKEELVDIETNGNGADISDLFDDPKFWNAEDEELTAEGYTEYERRNLEIAKERAGVGAVDDLSSLNGGDQTVQAEAFAAYADALGLTTRKSYSSGGSRYVEVDIGETYYKFRFADHFNTVRDTTMQPDFNVAPGRNDFTEAFDYLLRKLNESPEPTSDGALDLKRSADGRTQGFYDPITAKSFLIADNLTSDTAPGVLIHEIGIHAAADGTIDPLHQRAAELVAGDTSDIMREVANRMDAAGESSPEEAAAYIAEAYENNRLAAPKSARQWIADYVAAIRGWLYKKGILIASSDLTPADIAAIARANALAVAESGAQAGEGWLSLSSAGDQTLTAAFKRWFAGSIVTDAKGNPLVVYHGSPDLRFINQDGTFKSQKDRAGFGRSEQAHWFTPSLATAKSYADERRAFDYQNAEGGTVAAFIKLENPLIVDAGGANWRDAQRRGRTSDVIEEARAAGHDGVVIRNVKDNYNNDTKTRPTDTYVVFDSTQIKSATENTGAFDPENPDIRRSRAAIGELKQQAQSVYNAAANTPGKLGWWHKTVGTQYNLAQRSPEFKRVYDAVQSFLNDVSFFATESADLAPTILPKLENWRDIAKSPLSAADTKAIAAPIFEGTLTWMRDESGKPVKVADMEEQAQALTSEQKAQRLLRNNKISANVLKMWQGMEADKYDAAVSSKYESDMLKAGIVWTTSELQSLFKLTGEKQDDGTWSGQIGLYQEFRRATDKSLTDLALSDMLYVAGDDAAPIRDAVLASATPMEAAETIQKYLLSVAEYTPDRNDELLATADTMIDKASKVQDLIDRGYAPLSRFGNYTLDVVDDTGERVYFGLFEGRFEAEQMAKKMREMHPGANVTQGTLSEQSYKLFSGVSPETVALFGGMMGLDGNPAYQEYIKLAKSSRSALKRLIERKGIAGFSEDAGRVLAGFVYSNARQTSQNLHAGEMSDAANAIPQQQGELKDHAVNLVEYIKNPQQEAQQIRGLLFAQYIGGSVASAMVNMTQPLTMTLPWLSQYGGITKAAKQMAAAVVDANKKTTGDTALDAALKRAEEDGTVSPQEVHDLMRQAQGKGALQSGDGSAAGDAYAKSSNMLSRVSFAWGKLFSAAEQFNRRSTFIAAYRTAVEQGLGDPSKFAEQAIAETQGIYNKGNKPEWARGSVGSILFTFKQYSVAYVEMLSRMATAGKPGSPERAAGQRGALYALGVLMLLSGAGGLPGADDLDDLISGLMQAMGYNFDSKSKRKAFLVEHLGTGGADFVERGLSGLPGAPIDVSGRLGLGNLIPGTGLLTKKQDHTRDVLEFVGPAGDLFKRGFESAGKVVTGDIMGKNGAVATLAPKAMQNLFQAADMEQMGMYRDQTGKKVIDTDSGDALAKALGFQPGSVKRSQDASFEVQRMVGLNKINESRIVDKWAQGLFEKDPEKVQEARDELAQWNKNNPESPIRVKSQQIFSRVANMRMTQQQRIAKTAPAEIRREVYRELAQQ